MAMAYSTVRRASWGTCIIFFFFFSSRRRHTRFDCDWSSDVCSSDLDSIARWDGQTWFALNKALVGGPVMAIATAGTNLYVGRSEERRVGKECRSRWSPYH